MSETYTGVIDRIVEGTAVLLLESAGETVDQWDIPADLIPAEGRHEGAVFEIVTDDDRLELQHRPDTEADRRDAAQERFDRLSKRLDEE